MNLLVTSFILTLSVGAFAKSSFDKDLAYFKEGLRISGVDDKSMAPFRNPFFGKTSFILPVDKAPWAGNYFPMKEGGLANRWQSEKKIDLKTLPTKLELQLMSVQEINQLSPIEKYDIFMGDYTFKATVQEMYHRGPLRDYPVQDWEGFCNGVRCAGIHFEEPQHRVQVTNKDGIVISFEPADLKALSGATYFFVENYAQIGNSTPEGKKASAQPNAAVFDLSLRYFIAEKQKSFVIDSHLGEEVWNESVIGFERKLYEPEALTAVEKTRYPKAASKLKIDVLLKSLSEIKIEVSNKPTVADVAAGKMHKPTKMGYTLFLDSSGYAIDGIWDPSERWYKKPSERLRGVDFVWFSGGKGVDYKNPKNNGNKNLYFRAIKSLMKKSVVPYTCQKAFS